MHFIEHTAVGKRREEEDAQRLDEWDVGLLDQGDEEED